VRIGCRYNYAGLRFEQNAVFRRGPDGGWKKIRGSGLKADSDRAELARPHPDTERQEYLYSTGGDLLAGPGESGLSQEKLFQGVRNMEGEPRSGCPFCGDRVEKRMIAEEGTVIAVRDKYPVTDLHTLIVPKRHVPDYFDFTPEEREDAHRLLCSLRKSIRKEGPSVTGFNVGINCGLSAGQTIMHAHIHLIPRRDGDLPNPRGGVRGVIPEKMNYPTGSNKKNANL